MPLHRCKSLHPLTRGEFQAHPLAQELKPPAASIGTTIAITYPFMILAVAKLRHVYSKNHNIKLSFFAIKNFFHLPTRLPAHQKRLPANKSRIASFQLRLKVMANNDHLYPAAKTIRFNDDSAPFAS